MRFPNLLAAFVWLSALASMAGTAEPLRFDCHARATRSDDAPAPNSGDMHGWQCPAGTAAISSATQWQRHSVEYCRLTTSVYAAALAAAQTLKTKYHLRRHRWVVIMDADETLLDNSLNEVQRDRCNDTAFNNEVWESWVHARATPQSNPGMADEVPGAAEFTKGIHALGGLIAIVTNRSAADDPVTRDNLFRLGILSDYEVGQDANQPDERASKLTRWQRAVRTLSGEFHVAVKPVMWIGDQVTDLAVTDGQGNMIGAMSQADEVPGVGINRFLVPNPMYGNWKR